MSEMSPQGSNSDSSSNKSILETRPARFCSEPQEKVTLWKKITTRRPVSQELGTGWFFGSKYGLFDGTEFELQYFKDVKLTRTSILFLKQGGTQAQLFSELKIRPVNSTEEGSQEELPNYFLVFTSLMAKDMERLPIRARQLAFLVVAPQKTILPSFADLYQFGLFTEKETWL